MKLSKLLVLGAFALTSMSAMAVDGNVWTKPALPSEFATLQDGGIYYFLNEGSGLFFTQGNAYGTQASVGSTGLKVKVESAASMGENVWTLTDSVATQKAWKKWWFVDNGIDMYVDYNGQADYYWEITDKGAQTYRLSPSTVNPNVNDNTLFVGLDRTTEADKTALTANNTADGGAFIDWKLIPVEAYASYEAKTIIYEAAMALKALLDEAESIKADVADQIAVYNNTASTLEELQKAAEATRTAIEKRKLEIVEEQMDNATLDNPVDASAKITNPSFDGDKLTGWSGTAFGSYGPKENAEHYEKTYNTYQQIKDLRNGVYGVGVNAFYRAGNAAAAYTNYKAQNAESRYAKLYGMTSDSTFVTTSIVSPYVGAPTESQGIGSESNATDDETGETFYIPNNMVAAEHYMHQLGLYKNQLIIGINDGILTIGVKKDQTVGSDWSIFDDFSLIYYGQGADAYQKWLDEALASADDITPAEDVYYTAAYVEAYNAQRQSGTATTYEEVVAHLNALAVAAADLEKNISLWKEYVNVLDQARALVNATLPDGGHVYDDTTDAFMDCEDAIDDSRANLAALELTNEELEQIIADLQAAIKETRKYLMSDDVRIDVTYLLKNPAFDNNNWDGWTKTNASGGAVQVKNQCAEFWNNAQFDLYQEIPDVPSGVYEISVQGFYRYLRGDNAWRAWSEQSSTFVKSSPVFIYMNDMQTPFMNIFGELITDNSIFTSSDYNTFVSEADGNTYYAPDQMWTAADCFASPSAVNEGNNMYTQMAYGLVVNDGDLMRIGVKGSSNQGGDSWVIFDNFKLTFRGTAANVVSEVLLKEVAAAEPLLDSAMGKTIRETLQNSVNDAKTLAAGEDGRKMYQALLALIKAETAAKSSIELFATLTEAVTELELAIGDYTDNPTAQAEAGALLEELNAGLADGTIEDEQVAAYIDKINVAITHLKLPVNIVASDVDPLDLTDIIINPAYDNGKNTGWAGTEASVNENTMNAELFNKTYDYYQDIQGLPEGTYEVSVQGFYRAGYAADDYVALQKDSLNNSLLYAESSEGAFAVLMTRLAAHAKRLYEGEELPTDWTWASETDSLYVPNMMGTANDFMMEVGDEVKNTVTAKVGADGKLRIGLRKTAEVANDWTIFDNWTLVYYGKNSEKQPNVNAIQELEEAPVMTVEFFTLDGRKANGLQKGIVIQKTTMHNGTVVVKKIRK